MGGEDKPTAARIKGIAHANVRTDTQIILKKGEVTKRTQPQKIKPKKKKGGTKRKKKKEGKYRVTLPTRDCTINQKTDTQKEQLLSFKSRNRPLNKKKKGK